MARVLVVDDDPDIRQLLREFVQHEGHEVIEAADADAAFDALEHTPDAILIDVDMPGRTGVEFLLELRKHPTLADIPAALVTAHPDRALPAQRMGIAGPYSIQKPFRRHQITHMLKLLLTSARRRIHCRAHITPNAIQVTRGSDVLGVAKNLSFGGVLVATRQRWSVGQQLELSLVYSAQTHNVTARVTHIQRDCVGFTFCQPSQSFTEFAANTIADLLAAQEYANDRRDRVRVQTSAAIVLALAREQTGADLRDLSETGAYVVTDQPVQIGDQPYIYVPGNPASGATQQHSELRGCVAEVVRLGPDGFGCRFRDPSAEFQMAVTTLLMAGAQRGG